MAQIFYDDDADLGLIKSRKVAIIGYGSQGHAHALNLRDSGVEVRVALPEKSRRRPVAEKAGFTVQTAAAAAAWADVIIILAPDTAQPTLWAEDIAPKLRAGKTLVFAHGFNIRFGTITPPAGCRRRADRAQGPRPPRARDLRRRARACPRSSPCTRTRRGQAHELALSYAKGIGATRAGVLETTFAEETETDLFGEQAVLCGGVSRAGQGGLRDARRRRLPARGRLLRVPARAQAHRRPHVPRRPQLHALLGLRHRRVGRLRRRAARRRRERARRDEEAPRRDPVGRVRQEVDGRERRRAAAVRGARATASASRPSRGGQAAAQDDAVPRRGDPDARRLTMESSTDYVRIFDTTLRDGEQSPGATMTRDREAGDRARARAARRRRHRGRLPRRLARRPRGGAQRRRPRSGRCRARAPVICGLARARPRTSTWRGKASGRRRGPRIHTFLATCELHMKHKLRMTRARGARARARDGRPRAQPVRRRRVLAPRTPGAAIPSSSGAWSRPRSRAGATTLNIPDTVGYTMPDEFGALIAGIVAHVPGVEGVVLSVHCHDDLGLATANTLAGLRAGARQAEVTINGIGERAGNSALEEVVMALHTRAAARAAHRHRHDAARARLAAWWPRCTGIAGASRTRPSSAPTPSRTSRASTRTACSRTQQTYEIMQPETVGAGADAAGAGQALGARTRSRARLEELGYPLDDDGARRRVFARFKDARRAAQGRHRRRPRGAGRRRAAGAATSSARSRTCRSAAARIGLADRDGAPARARRRRPRRTPPSAPGRSTPPTRPSTTLVQRAGGRSLEFGVRAVTEGIDALGEVTRARRASAPSGGARRTPQRDVAERAVVPRPRRRHRHRRRQRQGVPRCAQPHVRAATCWPRTSRRRRGGNRSMTTAHAVREDLGCARRRRGGRRAGRALRRPAPGARGDLAAGVRRPARARARASGVRSAPWPRWTTRRRRYRAGSRWSTSRRARSSTRWRATAPTSASAATGWAIDEQRHRARHRARARPHAAGHDHRVRRQPHRHARRLRRARLRHRHQRGRARAGDAVPAAAAPETLEVRVDGALAARRDRQGPDPGADRAHRRRRRHRRASSSTPARRSAALDMEARMTVCNMSIEAGARAGLIAPDDTTFAVPRAAASSRRRAPLGRGGRALAHAWPATRRARYDAAVVARRAARSSR